MADRVDSTTGMHVGTVRSTTPRLTVEVPHVAKGYAYETTPMAGVTPSVGDRVLVALTSTVNVVVGVVPAQ